MRGFLAGLLLVVGILLTPLADLGIWTRRVLLPTAAFTNLATDVVQQDAVQSALATRLSDELITRQPRLAAGRGVLEPAVVRVLDTPQFEAIFRIAIGSTHGQLVRGDDQLTLDLNPMIPIVRDFVASVDQGVASQIPDVALPAFTIVRKAQVPQVWWGVDVTRRASWVFPVLMVLALAAAVAVAKQRALTLVIAGAGVAVMCLLIIISLRVGRGVLSDVVGPEVDVQAFEAGYRVVTDSFVTQTFVLCALGILAAVVGILLKVLPGSGVRPTRPATA